MLVPTRLSIGYCELAGRSERPSGKTEKQKKRVLIFSTQKLMQQILSLLKILTEETGFILTFDCVPMLNGLFLFLGELKYSLCISTVSSIGLILQQNISILCRQPCVGKSTI